MPIGKVWVLAEKGDSGPTPVTLELLTEARAVASTVEAVAWGGDAASLRLALMVLAPSGFWAAYHLYLASRTIIADQKRAIGYTKDWAP